MRRHKLPARRDNLGRLLLRLADLPADLSVSERGRTAHTAALEHAQPAQPDPSELLELREKLAEERITRARLEERLAAGEQRETKLRTAFARERAVLEDRIADMDSSLAAERNRADRLEAVLAAARRPWLAEVLEGLRRKG